MKALDTALLTRLLEVGGCLNLNTLNTFIYEELIWSSSSSSVSPSIFLSSGVYCDLSVDGIGTCWPRSAAGELISRPCPEQFNGIHYNTTSRYHRGTRLSKSHPITSKTPLINQTY
uniref:G-protein coupled receptors family 2 profile 1 domain-containing protein n=1 Tax=Stegastes partitus TaxID=144197 RepID=A0A3B5AQL2_9TELE